MAVPYFGFAIGWLTRRITITARAQPARAILESSLLFVLISGALTSFRGCCKLFQTEKSDEYQKRLRRNGLESSSAVTNRVHVGFTLVWVCCMTSHVVALSLLCTAAVTMLTEMELMNEVAVACACLSFFWLYYWFQIQLGMAPWSLLALLEIAMEDIRQLEEEIEGICRSPISASRVRELTTNYMRLHGRLRALSAVPGNAPALLLSGTAMQSIGLLLKESLDEPLERHPHTGSTVNSAFLAIISPSLVAFVRMALIGLRCDRLGKVAARILSQTNQDGRSELHEDADCTELLLRFAYTVQAVPTGWFIGSARAGPSLVLRACISVLLAVMKKSFSICFPDDWAEGAPKPGTILFVIGLVLLSAGGTILACLQAEVETRGSPSLEVVELPVSQTQPGSELLDPPQASVQAG